MKGLDLFINVIEH